MIRKIINKFYDRHICFLAKNAKDGTDIQARKQFVTNNSR